MDAFLDDSGETWATQDPKMGEEWVKKVADFKMAGMDDSKIS
jgi:hypothetical protein